MRAKKYMQKALVVTLTSVMLAGTVAPALPVEAATQKSVVVSNERTVLVAGRNYYVQNENATNFKSSNEAVASIDETGKITPKKTGYVTISATVDGEKVKTKFMCVSKFGVTSSQTKIDKMLEAENVKNISIVTAKDVDYQIAEGDYAKKTLTVKAPNADVDNHGTFKKIKIKDVADNTFRNYKPNKFTITDKKFRFAEKAKGSEITIAEGADGRVIAQGKDTVIKSSGKVEVKPQGKNVSIAKVEVNGGQIELNLKKLAEAIKEVLIQKAADVKISGGQKADVKVTVGEDAKGTTINSDTTVDLVVKAEITINLTGNAGGSKIDIADGVEVVVKVDANVDGAVTVGDTEVKAGETATVDETGKVEVTETPTEGDTSTDQKPSEDTNVPSGGGSGSSGGSTGGSTGGDSSQTGAVEVTTTYDENSRITTYKFGTNIADLKTFTANIKGTEDTNYHGEIKITNVTKLLELQKEASKKFTDVDKRIENWSKLSNGTAYDCGADTKIVITDGEGSYTRTIEGPGYTAKVTLCKLATSDKEGLAAEVTIGNAQQLLIYAVDETSFNIGKIVKDADGEKRCLYLYKVTIKDNTVEVLSINGRNVEEILTFTNVTK